MRLDGNGIDGEAVVLEALLRPRRVSKAKVGSEKQKTSAESKRKTMFRDTHSYPIGYRGRLRRRDTGEKSLKPPKKSLLVVA